MEITVTTIQELYAKHEVQPIKANFYGETLTGQPCCCLLGILDVEQRGLPVVAKSVNRIESYVARIARQYGWTPNFVRGLMLGWDWWDFGPETLGYDVDPAGFKLGQALGRALLEGATH